ncbi:hypothetical protein [Pseudodesulfovibrio indicus]|uniref:hypothetical protein n=1 Tax=Pseudodesulfovibrio indicus TaxID=1716143 RepID=UPI00292F3AB4|nr:hypothetical protein [Pseudodesulfovibrio indicus]
MKHVSMEDLEQRVFPAKFREQMDKMTLEENSLEYDHKQKRVSVKLSNAVAIALVLAITVIVLFRFDQVLAKFF